MALAPQSSKVDAALQEAIQHHQAGRLDEAERLYRRILRGRPSHSATNNALGIALKDQGRLDEAAAVFRRVVAVSPDHAPAHSNLGNILFSQGQLAEAEACYRRALTLRPDMPDALKNLGLVIVDQGRFEESHGWFNRHAELVYGKPDGAVRSGAQVPAHKTRHDQEQRDFIKGGEPGSGGTAPIFNREDGERVAGRAVNPDSSGGAIAARWQNEWPQVAVIDNLLSDEALNKLRRFCWGSTIWQMAHPNGYVGAMPEHGFACPLLAQINEELRSNFPVILGEHPLLRWWGFKYDSRLSGINCHADFAAVNVNFWLTPDEANLEPGTGGLVIYDKPAPLEWGFAQYNGAGQAVHDFLKQNDAKSVTVPYRANRAVIFDSDLFHETDKIVFKEGYTNRRLNITMLYGTRERAKPSAARPS